MPTNRSRSCWVVAVVAGVCLAMAVAPGVAQAQQTAQKGMKPVTAKPVQENPQSQFRPIHLVLVKYEGRVVDDGAKPLPGMKVTLTGPRTYTATTDANGVFRFSGVRPGTYTVKVHDPNGVFIDKVDIPLYNLIELIPNPR